MARPRKKIIEYRIYKLPIHFPVLLLEGEEWHISDVKSGRLHFHNCFEVGMCHTDSGIMEFEGTEKPFAAGDITCVPPHIAHTTYSAKGVKSLWTYLFLDFGKFLGGPAALWGGMQPDKGLDFYFIFNRDQYPQVYACVSGIIAELRQRRPGYDRIVAGLFQALYYMFLRQRDHPAARVRTDEAGFYTLAPALDYICYHYMNRFSINALAEICHLSPTHFRRLFLSAVGCTPLHFLNTVRVEKACELLNTTSESILTISEAVGFYSVSSFSRCFLQIMGLSPRGYRHRAAEDDAEPTYRFILPYAGWSRAEEL